MRRKHEPLAAIPEQQFEQAVHDCKANGARPTAARAQANLNSTEGVGNEGADQWYKPLSTT